MAAFVDGELSIEVLPPVGGVLRLDWHGKSTSREPVKVLAPLFAEVTRDAAAAGATLELHFEGLQLFNSSTITALIRLIQTCRGQAIPVLICYDAAQKVQRLSFDALRVFEKSDGLVRFRSSER